VPEAVVVGAGVFGAWTAWYLRRAGLSVTLLDAYSPASVRASSGGETRLTRAGYGPDLIYTRAAVRSLEAWKTLERRTGRSLFENCGVLTIGRANDQRVRATWDTLRREDVRAEGLSAADLRRRFAQMTFADDEWGVLEPDAGVLRARLGVHTVVDDAVRMGVEYRTESFDVRDGVARRFSGAIYIFACGPWLPRLFPDLL
jgi:glycine/D-amino acid oxidase-like deaminating enzyme